MDRKAIRKRLENRKNKVEHVLNEYCSENGCPCNYRQFIYWAGKQQGPGWQDSVQNQLVESTLELDCFSRIDKCENTYGLEGSYDCSNCGTKWNHFSEEWRMLAFRKRLLKVGGDDPCQLYEDLISNNIFATIGHEPEGLKTLSLEQWTAFMLGMDYGTELYQPYTPGGKTETGSR